VKELAGRVAVVTGAASGIGRGLARGFVAQGMGVVLADVEQEPLDGAVRELQDAGGQVIGVPTDVSRLEQVEALAEQTLSRFGGVHVVCNNAGVGSGAALAEIPLEVWHWVMGVNFWGVLYGCQVFLPLLRSQAEGHIVNTASVAALCGEAPTTAPYVASKAAVLGMSETLQRELEDAGEPIGVSVLLPGPVNTNIPTSERNRPPGVPSLRDHPSQKLAEGFLRSVMGTNWLEPDEVAAMVIAAVRENRFYIVTHPERTVDIARKRLVPMGIADAVGAEARRADPCA
jgi:NAD(P)-dependent dehydrogenase (short-subunit alcohol dehydrogenase family)